MDDLYEKAKKAYSKGDKFEQESIREAISKLQYTPTEKTSKFVSYPSTTEKDFNRIIFSKKEFHKNKYLPPSSDYDKTANAKCSLDLFQLTENQKFLKHFMSSETPYNSILLFHSVGTGKTCTAISIAEQYSKIFKKKHLVLVSPNLRDNFKKQIFDISKVSVVNGTFSEKSNQCTGVKYLDLIPDKQTMNKDMLESKVKKVVGEQYQFKGFVEFSNDYDKLKEKVETFEKNDMKQKKRFDDELKGVYSDRVIIIDEVHNLRLASEQTQKQVPPKLEHVLKVATNVKLILLTATPMFNNVTEIIWLLNLMLLNDKQPTIKIRDVFSDGQISRIGEQKLIEASRGRVSFMRGSNPYTFPFRLYPNVNKDPNIFKKGDKPKFDIFNLEIKEKNTLENLNLIKSTMSAFQEKVYSLFEQRLTKRDIEMIEHEINANEYDGENEGDDVNGKTDIQMGLQVSNMVYPTLNETNDIKEYYWTKKEEKKGFWRCFNPISTASKRLKVSYDPNFTQSFGEIFSYDQISTYSAKIKSIIDYITNSEGIVYIYSTFIYSGILPIAIALEHMGFSKYGGNSILHNAKEKKSFRINGKQAQYIILSANQEISPNNDDEIRIAKSDSNVEGEVIKVIIGSSVATEGIDFKRIREIHVLEPWYHLQKLEQIFGRGIRHCSHVSLPLEKRNVTIYQHANTRKNHRETIDVRIYRIADKKQNLIKQVTDILKSNAIDCLLNKTALYFDPKEINRSINLKTSQKKVVRNFSIGDEELQRSSCTDDDKNIEIDESTFKVQFLDDEIDIYITYIVELYKNKLYYTYIEIKDGLNSLIENLDEDILKYALNVMLERKIRVVNLIKGNTFGYLIFRGKRYLFQRFDKANERMTIEERQNEHYITPRKKLDIKYFASSASKSEMGSADAIITFIENKVSELHTSVQGRADYRACCYDFIIDRLSQTDMFTLVEYILANPAVVNEQIYNSIVESGVFLTKTKRQKVTKKFLFYVDYQRGEDRFFMIKNDKLIKCPTGKLSNVMKLESEFKRLVEQNSLDLHGFVSDTIINHRFKMIIRDSQGNKGASSGSVCHANSKLSVAQVKELITSVDNNINPTGNKGRLCDIYELVLRKNIPNRFARPYPYYLMKLKKDIVKK